MTQLEDGKSLFGGYVCVFVCSLYALKLGSTSLAKFANFPRSAVDKDFKTKNAARSLKTHPSQSQLNLPWAAITYAV